MPIERDILYIRVVFWREMVKDRPREAVEEHQASDGRMAGGPDDEDPDGRVIDVAHRIEAGRIGRATIEPLEAVT